MPETFDVFLSHNSKDKPAVRELGEALKARGLKVWIDESSLLPGSRWIPALEKAIKTVKVMAVLVGKSGFGPWEQTEYEGALRERVRRKLLASLTRLALPGLAPVPSSAQAEEVAAVLAWLQAHDRWLLILDNVDTQGAAAAVEDLLPALTRGHVLLTSRRREWSAGIRKQLLGALAEEEAVQFLLQRTEGERSLTPTDAGEAQRLAEILDGLPLAIEQAAAYIAHHQISFARYLADWETQRPAVLSY